MRYGIFADVHSNLEALDAVIKAYKDEKIDQYFCLGDVVGYGVNPCECIENVKSLSAVTVAGNHDWATVNLLSLANFRFEAAEAIHWTRRQIKAGEKDFLESLKLTYKNADFSLAHGTLDNPKDFNYMNNGYTAWESLRLLETKVGFVGHSHVAGIFSKISDDVVYRQDDLLELAENGKYIVNVGSVGQPRDGNPQAAFCIYDTEQKKVFIKRVKYDVDKTRQKIIDSGLPRSLGDRLMLGM